MIHITFGLIQETYILGDTRRTSYGIAAFVDTKTDGSATVVDAVHDIGSDRERLTELIRRCNDLHLSTLHLHDVVEDILADTAC